MRYKGREKSTNIEDRRDEQKNAQAQLEFLASADVWTPEDQAEYDRIIASVPPVPRPRDDRPRPKPTIPYTRTDAPFPRPRLRRYPVK